MQIYIKSAGFSINQDYSWIDESGKNVDIDLSILSYNVDDIKFVWKCTGDAIYIFGNAFTDKSRMDLYNRPLRNYILLVGQMDEAVSMSERFEKMLLDQENFEELLNRNIRSEGGDSVAGFSANFERISLYLDTRFQDDRKVRKLKRHLYENDSYEARQGLLDELWDVRSKPVTLLVGGELSDSRMKAIDPDRALLNHISDTGYTGDHMPFAKTVAIGVAAGTAVLATSVLALALNRKKD